MSSITASSTIPFYYLDRQGKINEDHYNGRLAYLIRCVTSLWRDYNLSHVNIASEGNLSIEIRQIIASKIAKKCHITPTQFSSLCGMTVNNDYYGAKYEEFFIEIRNNKSFNTNIRKLIEQGGKLEGISNELLQEVSAFSYKTMMEDKLVQAADKAQIVMHKYVYKETISDTEKLTLQEVRSLESIANMLPILNKIGSINLESMGMKQFSEASKISDHFIHSMLSKAEREIPYTSGTYIIYNLTNDYALRGQKVGLIQNFVYKYILGTNINHIAVGYKEDGKDMEAHMWGSPSSVFKNERRSLGSRCFKTIQLDPLTLVNEADSKKMEILFGNDWRNQTLEAYAKVSKDYFNNNPELKQLSNPSLRRLFAAIGFRFSMFNKPWEERCEFPPNKEVICSEFSVLSSMQCVKQLNTIIKYEWDKLKKLEPAPKLNPPVRDNRRLNRVIPHEIVHRFVEMGCAHIEDQAPCIKATIKFDDQPVDF